MVGSILILVLIALIFLWFWLITSDKPDYAIVPVGLFAFVIAIVLLFSFLSISSATHDAKHEDRSPIVVVDKVDRQGGVYIFTMEDGTQVAKSSTDVVESDTYGAEATIQYGNEYYSWGSFWFGEDWAGDEKVYYTPSNGG